MSLTREQILAEMGITPIWRLRAAVPTGLPGEPAAAAPVTPSATSAASAALEVGQAPRLKSSNTFLKCVFKLLCLVAGFLDSDVVTFLSAFPTFCRRTIKPIFRCSS